MDFFYLLFIDSINQKEFQNALDLYNTALNGAVGKCTIQDRKRKSLRIRIINMKGIERWTWKEDLIKYGVKSQIISTM